MIGRIVNHSANWQDSSNICRIKIGAFEDFFKVGQTVGLKWRYIGERITRENVVELEKKLNLKLPLDYVSHMLEINGGMPEPAQIDFGKETRGLGELFEIHDTKKMNLFSVYISSRDILPHTIIPFAIDGGGNYYCFDYINGEPTIVYLDGDYCYPLDDLTDEHLLIKPADAWQREAIRPVCNSFTELLQRLY